MKNKITFFLISGIIILSTSASAQFSIGLQGSYHTNSGENNKDAIGKGLQGKYFFKKIPLAVGGGMRQWVNNYEKVTVNGVDTKSIDMSTSFAAFAEWYFGTKKFRPYVGTDIGVYASNISLSMREKSFTFNADNRQTNFGVAPKAGMLFKTGVVSPFIQAQYHFLFNGNTEGNLPEQSNSRSSFATVDIGVLFSFGKCKSADKK